MSDPASGEIIENSRRIFEQQRQRLYRRTDRMFAVLMALQWVGGVVAARQNIENVAEGGALG